MITRPASRGRSRTWVACPSPSSTHARCSPRRAAARNCSTAASKAGLVVRRPLRQRRCGRCRSILISRDMPNPFVEGRSDGTPPGVRRRAVIAAPGSGAGPRRRRRGPWSRASRRPRSRRWPCPCPPGSSRRRRLLSAIAWSTMSPSSSLACSAQAPLLHDRGGVAALVHQHAEHLLGGRRRHRPLAHHRHELRRAPRAPPPCRPGRRRRCCATSSPVTQLAIALGSPPSVATAASKKSPSSARKASSRAASARQAQVALEAARRAAAGSSGSAARARSSISSVGATGTRSGSGK